MKPRALCAFFASVALAIALQFAGKPAFEVASIKPADPAASNSIFVGMTADRAIVRYTNISLRDCIRAAYRVRDFQITGPDWMSRARFDISARLPEGSTADQIPDMLQQLLLERFRLDVRHETREQPVYALAVGPRGPRLKPAETKSDRGPTALGPDGKPRSTMMFRVSDYSVTITAPWANLASLAELMSRFTERPVVDTTGIQGQYEFNLTFVPETTRGLPAGMLHPDVATSPPEPVPSLFSAVEEYGLKLERRKAPIDFLIVTHIERTPAEN